MAGNEIKVAFVQKVIFDATHALQAVLESRVWWRTPGTTTLEFEQAFASFHGAQYGIAVTNGTAALEVTLAALGIKSGDEVIVPNFTFVATASAVLFANALPVLVDVSARTHCIDPDLAEAAITPRTKAIIAVHMIFVAAASSTWPWTRCPLRTRI